MYDAQNTQVWGLVIPVSFMLFICTPVYLHLLEEFMNKVTPNPWVMAVIILGFTITGFLWRKAAYGMYSSEIFPGWGIVFCLWYTLPVAWVFASLFSLRRRSITIETNRRFLWVSSNLFPLGSIVAYLYISAKMILYPPFQTSFFDQKNAQFFGRILWSICGLIAPIIPGYLLGLFYKKGVNLGIRTLAILILFVCVAVFIAKIIFDLYNFAHPKF